MPHPSMTETVASGGRGDQGVTTAPEPEHSCRQIVRLIVAQT